ncbi:MAG TPA: hypothetical protein VJ001_02165, partial [Rhodocyclaceae bacterium]|nr:hypothetical protein [Rhodocyclaceae bacterium]
MKKIRFLSLETHLGVIFLLFLLLPTLSTAWLAYDYAIALTKSERIKTVGRVADLRHEQLRMVFHRAIGRAEGLLVDLNHRCDGLTRGVDCLRDGLNFFLHSENALGVALLAPDASVLTVGESEVTRGDIPSFKSGQLAQFTRYASGQRRNYYILIDDPHSKHRLAVTYPLQAIQSVFVSHPDLGDSGETFLADSQGFFITTARYPSTQGHSHPIS